MFRGGQDEMGCNDETRHDYMCSYGSKGSPGTMSKWIEPRAMYVCNSLVRIRNK